MTALLTFTQLAAKDLLGLRPRAAEPQAHALSDRFRCIRYDLRFWGRSESPGVAFSSVEDAIGVLDALDVKRAALVGLSLGGGLALDVALAYPDRGRDRAGGRRSAG